MTGIKLILLLSAIILGGACTLVGGGIPPSQFRFIGVINHQGTGSGGWKVAKVAILLGRLSSYAPETAVCEIEVGVPEVNHLGRVPDEVAQSRSAAAANTAARFVLRERLPVSALLCQRFRTEMQRILSAEEMIPGATVTAFITAGVPHTTFP